MAILRNMAQKRHCGVRAYVDRKRRKRVWPQKKAYPLSYSPPPDPQA